MITGDQARALRRLLLVAAGLGATLAAHAVGEGGMRPTTAAPFVWGSILSIAVVARRPARVPWREWSRAGLLARLLGLQVVLHLLVTGAPWAFGVTEHHAAPLVAPAMLTAHAVAAALLGVALLSAQRALGLLQRVAGRIRRALRATAPRSAPSLPLSAAPQAARAGVAGSPRTARGPPAAGRAPGATRRGHPTIDGGPA